VRGLFPYIKATFPKSRYFDRPEFIRFVFDGALVNLFPDEAFAGPFFIQEESPFLTRATSTTAPRPRSWRSG